MDYLIVGAVCAAGLVIPVVLGFAQRRRRAGTPPTGAMRVRR